ncbi:MAG: hypothetical protein ACXVAW_15510, partial [Vulcanimicrobiaceae bacterium]
MFKSLSRLALVGAILVGLCGPTGAAEPLALPANADLHESYRLLTTTFYSKVDPQRILDGARNGLDALLSKHGGGMLPALHAGGDAQANVSQLDSAVAKAAAKSHL